MYHKIHLIYYLFLGYQRISTPGEL